MAQNIRSRLACSNGHNARTTRALMIMKIEEELFVLLPMITSSKKPNAIQLEIRNKATTLQFKLAELKAIKSRGV